MKIKTKTNYLLGIVLLVFLVFGIVNLTNGAEKNVIVTTSQNSNLHAVSLRSLFLGSNEYDTGLSLLKVGTGRSVLDVLNGLIIGKNNDVNGSSKMVVIGGGQNNTINDSNAGIGGGNGNKVNGDGGAIGGGMSNNATGIIGGGRQNKTDSFGVVVGGYNNTANNGGVVLGGRKNKAVYENSLVLGSGGNGGKNSFSWNALAKSDSARINASGGMLIGTYTPISGVSLVVSGAIKLGSGNFNSITGGIWVDGSGCIKASDGNSLYTIGRTSESNGKCGYNTGCMFGGVELHNGDKVTAYSGSSYASGCETIKTTVTCSGGQFYLSGNLVNFDIYPYCYELSSDPTITGVTMGFKRCTGLPDNAEWVNGYKKSTSSAIPTHSDDQSKECSYKCKEGSEWSNGKCENGCYGNLPENNIKTGTVIPTSATPWTYTSSTNPGACQWTCVSGYHVDGNECVGNTKQGNCIAGTIEHGRYIVEQVDVTWNTSTNDWNTVPCTHFTCNTGYQVNSAGTGCEAIQYQCTGVSVGTNLEHTVFVTGTDSGLTGNTKKELYATYAEARDNKKCAYVCDAAHGWVYDNTDGKACRAVTTICGGGANECLNPAIATNMGGDASKYTWDCAVEGTVVKAGCFMCKDGYADDGNGNCEKVNLCGYELAGVISSTPKITKACSGAELVGSITPAGTSGDYTKYERTCSTGGVSSNCSVRGRDLASAGELDCGQSFGTCENGNALNRNSSDRTRDCIDGDHILQCVCERNQCPEGYEYTGGTCKLYLRYCLIDAPHQSSYCFDDTDSRYKSTRNYPGDSSMPGTLTWDKNNSIWRWNAQPYSNLKYYNDESYVTNIHSCPSQLNLMSNEIGTNCGGLTLRHYGGDFNNGYYYRVATMGGTCSSNGNDYTTTTPCDGKCGRAVGTLDPGDVTLPSTDCGEGWYLKLCVIGATRQAACCPTSSCSNLCLISANNDKIVGD